MNKGITLFLLIIALSSCTGNSISSDSKSLPEFWDLGFAINFDIPELPQNKKYDIFLELRNTNDYPFSNIFLVTSLKFPNGKTEVDTLEYRMARPDGTWLGEGLGTIKQNKLHYKENFEFKEKGTYTLLIEQAVRNNGDVTGVRKLDGITDVGYSIEVSE